MGKANRLIIIALSAVMVLIVSARSWFGWNWPQVPMKPDILYDLAAYDLCDAARDMVNESVVLYAGSPFALVNGAPVRVRAGNPQAVPIIDNNEVYVPAAFIAEAFGAESSWYTDAAAMSIKNTHTNISFITGQDRISLNGTQVFLPYPTFYKNGEAYIHLPSICEVFGRSVSCLDNIIMVNPIGKTVDLNEDRHIVNDLLYYFGSGPHEPAELLKADQGIKGKRIKIFLNEDELNSYTFPITEIDPDASAHNHELIVQDNVIMAPVVLLRLLDIEVFESVKRNSISLLEAAPFGSYTSLTLKPGNNHVYFNLQGEDPYKNEDAFKDRLAVLPTAPKLMNNHLYIPIIEISRLFGMMTDWDQQSSSVRIRSLSSHRFPNLRWTPHIMQIMNTDYKLVATIHIKDSGGKDIHRVNCISSGHYDSGEYSGQAAVSVSAEGSAAFDSKALYKVQRYLNKDFEYQYSVKSLEEQNSQNCSEVLMADIEYLRRKTELLTSHYYASNLLKKQTDVKLAGRIVDKYSIELNDMLSITELFGITKPPAADLAKSKITGTEAFYPEYFRMEVSIDKKGCIANCSIFYRGHLKKERQMTSPEFEVSISADFF